MGEVEVTFSSVEDEARYCMETAFLNYMIEHFGFNNKANITNEVIEKCWKKMTNTAKTEMKNRAVGVWISRVLKRDSDIESAFKKMPRSIFSLDRAWRKIYNFMNEKNNETQ